MKLFGILYLIFFSIYIQQNAYADETFIICSNQDETWQWLKTENGLFYVAHGNFVIGEFEKNSKIYLYSYFKIQNGERIMQQLKNLCHDKYGQDYANPQPANSSLSPWTLFSISDNQFMGGILAVRNGGFRHATTKKHKIHMQSNAVEVQFFNLREYFIQEEINNN
ncbi:hypothetical protein [Silvanigrella aquatica]|uniref:Uncharacterized protein n=1 Tax=Silvanigrella aquatica TaxID=1915309 RepID=A0A1L4D481_9BACT|nr:hypothetical protein [Silvanigrella aquatica]APJ04990.1 hypothetical protein AXG55_14255 [Silvanigrella aquatica]